MTITHYVGDVAECKGGGGATTTVQQADPWVGQQPYLQFAFKQAHQLYTDPAYRPSYYPASTVAPLSAESQMAMDLTRQRALGGSAVNQAAQRQMISTLNGQYMGANPYLDQTIQAAMRPVVENYQQAVLPTLESRFARSGRFGSGAYQTALGRSEGELARSLSEMAGSMRAQNYQSEREAQQRAMLAAPGLAQADYADLEKLAAVGAMADDRAQVALDYKVARHQFQTNLQRQMLAEYLGLIQGNYGSSSVQTTRTPRPNPLMQGMSGVMAGAQIGSLFPGVGTAIGAGVGGLFGLVM